MAQNDIIVYNFLHLENLSTRMGWIVQALDNVKSVSEKSDESASEYWQGQAYNAFSERMAELNASLNKLYEQISSSKSRLDKAIEMEKQNEENISKQTVGGLAADEIFL